LKKEENFDITIYNDFNVDYQQAAILNRALKTAYSKEKFDWAFMIDADEFIDVKRKDLESALSKVPAGMIPSLQWRTWIPKNGNYEKYSAPLLSNFQLKAKEIQAFDKVVLPGVIIPSHFVGEGNHTVYRHVSPFDETPVLLQKYVMQDVPLDHFPVRSPTQLITKILIGSYKLSIKSNRPPTDAYHWDIIANKIRKANYEISDDLLKEIAHSYAAKEKQLPSVDYSVDETKKFGVQYDTIKYKELSKIKDVVRYDSFMAALSGIIRNIKK
jgi:hypothetical protein